MLNRFRFAGLRVAVLKRLRNRRFWRDSGLLMLANVIVLGLGVIRTPAMTWLLPKEQVGMMGVVAAWLPFLQLLSLSGLDSASYHYVAKGQPWAFVINLAYRLRWSLLSAAGFLAGAAYWWWQGEIPLAWMFVIAGVSYPVTIGLSACSGMLGAQENFVGLFWYRLGESITDFVGFVPLLLSTWLVNQVVTFYGANQVATAVMQVGVSVWIVRQLRRSQTPSLPPEDAHEMVRYGKHLTVMNSIGVAQTRVDALLIGSFLPLSIMADYSIALLVNEQLKRLWNIYFMVRYPPLVRMPLTRRRRRLLLEGIIIWLGFIALGLILAIAAHWLIPVLLPATYTSSLGYINWLIVAFIASVPGIFAELYYRSVQDEKRLYWLRGITAFVSVTLSIVLLKPLGVFGVLLARLSSSITLSVIGIFLFWYDGRHQRIEQTKSA